MKKALLTITAIALTLFAVSQLSAQGKGYGRGCGGCGYGNGGGYHGMMNPMALKERLSLNDEQVEKIFKIGTEYREKMFRERGNPDKIAAIRIEHRKAVESVLTREQKEKFVSWKEGRRGNGRGNDCRN